MITPADSEVLRLAREWVRLKDAERVALRSTGNPRALRAACDAEWRARYALLGAARAAYGEGLEPTR